MDLKDFSASILPEGYFLYFRGHCIGAGKSELYHARSTAMKEINDIISGHGLHAFMAAVSCLERKEKGHCYEKNTEVC